MGFFTPTHYLHVLMPAVETTEQLFTQLHKAAVVHEPLALGSLIERHKKGYYTEM